MNAVLEYFREREPAFRDVSDDELTRYIGERKPEFLQVPEFKTVFEARQQQAQNTANTAEEQAVSTRVARTWLDMTSQLNDLSQAPGRLAMQGVGAVMNRAGDLLAEDARNVIGMTPLDPVGPVAGGLQDAARMAPQIGAAMLLQSAGVPAPLAFGLPGAASVYEQTGDAGQAAKAATVGALIPGVAQAGRMGAARGLAAVMERGLVSPSALGQRAVEAAGAQGALFAFLESLNLPEYALMNPQQARETLLRNLVANTAFLALDVPGIRNGGDTLTQERLSPAARAGSELAELVRKPEVIDYVQGLADQKAAELLRPPTTTELAPAEPIQPAAETVVTEPTPPPVADAPPAEPPPAPVDIWPDVYKTAAEKGVTLEIVEPTTGERTVTTLTGRKAARAVKRQKGILDALDALRNCLEGGAA